MIRPLSNSKSVYIGNKKFDFVAKQSVKYNSTQRLLHDTNAIKVRFDLNENNNQKLNPSFKKMPYFMQFSKKSQIMSSKSIKNSANISNLLPTGIIY